MKKIKVILIAAAISIISASIIVPASFAEGQTPGRPKKPGKEISVNPLDDNPELLVPAVKNVKVKSAYDSGEKATGGDNGVGEKATGGDNGVGKKATGGDNGVGEKVLKIK